MNILLVTNELGYRGTPRFLVNCATLARQAGHQSLVWGLQEGGAAEKTCAESDIPVRIGLDALDDALAFAPHVVHVHRAGGVSDRDSALLRFLKRKTGCRILETNVFGSADLTVPDPIDLHTHISRWDLWRWRRWFWPFRRPGIYLPYCVDTSAFRPVPPDGFRLAHGIPSEALVVGRIGKTDWDELRKAVIPALRDCPRVVFVSIDDYSGAAEDFAGWPADCRARVVRVPALRGADELSAFYSACDLTLNFSPIGESFGYVVAEAMACGTPVIAHSKPRNDNAQVEIADARFGAYPVSTAEAALGVIQTCADTPPAPEQRERCRDSIIHRYSLDVFAPRLDLAYRTLAETKRRGRALERTFARLGFETDIPDFEIAERLERVLGEKPTAIARVKTRLAYSLPNALRLQRICRRDFPNPVPDELKERMT